MNPGEPGTKRVILALAVVGLLTFFLPSAHVMPSALGKADWSAYAVTMTAMSRASLPALGLYAAFEYWSPYAILGVSLLLLLAPEWHKLFFASTATNLFCVGKWDFDKITFYSLDTRWPAGGAFGHLPAYYGFALVLALVLYLTWIDHRNRSQEQSFHNT